MTDFSGVQFFSRTSVGGFCFGMKSSRRTSSPLCVSPSVSKKFCLCLQVGLFFVRCAFWILSTHSSVKVDTLLTHFVLLWSGPAVEPHALAGEDHEILNV